MQRNIPAGPRPTDVYFFATCLVDLFCPEAGMDAIQLLEREGIRVPSPKTRLAAASQFTPAARTEARLGRRNSSTCFRKTGRCGAFGSCAGMMFHHYPSCLPKTRYARRRPTHLRRVFERSSCSRYSRCSSRMPASRPKSRCIPPVPPAARWAPTCMRANCSAIEWRRGADAVTHESECCGFSGTFSVRQPEISASMAGDKADSLKRNRR